MKSLLGGADYIALDCEAASWLSVTVATAAIARLKVLSGLDIAERRRAQDGRIQALYQDAESPKGRAVDFRLSVPASPLWRRSCARCPIG